MINTINKETRLSMSETPTGHSNKNRCQGAQEALKQKQDRAQGRARTGQSLTIKYNMKRNDKNRQDKQRKKINDC
jgi:hypothetical protein